MCMMADSIGPMSNLRIDIGGAGGVDGTAIAAAATPAPASAAPSPAATPGKTPSLGPNVQTSGTKDPYYTAPGVLSDGRTVPTQPATAQTPVTNLNGPGGAAGGVQQSALGLMGFDAAKYLAANPDVMQGYQAALATADPNSPAFMEKGLNSPEAYAAWHYQNYGISEGRSPNGAAGTSADQAGQTQTDLITNLTNSVNTAITQAQQEAQQQIGALTTALTGLTGQGGQIDQLTQGFQKSQQDLLEKMNQQTADSSKAMADMINRLQAAQGAATSADAAARMATGQTEKKPNYARALSKARDLNTGGLSATMLTGPMGVAPTSLTLGRTALLGA